MKLKNNKEFIINIINILSFLFLAYFYVSFFIKSGKLLVVSDGSFHFSRAEEIYTNLKQGNIFTFIATHTFSHSGNGSFLFYPSVYLYLWAALRFIVNPVSAYYVWVGLFIFLTLSISYICMLDFSKDKYRSYIFALLYSLSNYHFFLGLGNQTLGEYQAYSFIPIIFLGIYHLLWGDSSKWYIVSIGLALTAYAHILSVYISCLFAASLFIAKLIYSRKIKKYRLCSILKAIILLIILIAPIIWIFVNDFIGENIQSPAPTIGLPLTFVDLMNNTFYNVVSKSNGILLFVLTLVGWYFVRKNKTEMNIYCLGLFITLFLTTIFPWEIIKNTPLILVLGQIQYPYRLLTFSSFLLSVTGSYVLNKVIVNQKIRYHKNLMLIFLILLNSCVYLGQVSSLYININNNNNYLIKNSGGLEKLPNDKVISKENYQDIFTYTIVYGETDYYSKESYNGNDLNSNKLAKSIISQKTFLGNKQIKVQKKKYLANKIRYTVDLNKKGMLNLPIIGYKHINVSIDGKKISKKISQRGTVLFKIDKGKHVIEVNYNPGIMYYVLMSISIVGWGIVGHLLLKRK